MIGKHRLICGDCRDGETIRALFGDVRANVVVTSPPYATQREYDATTAATLEQALAAAKKYARPDTATLLLVGDRTKIEAGIRELQLGEIVVLDTEGRPPSGGGRTTSEQ